MTNLKNIALSAAVIAAMTGCGDTTINQTPSDVTIVNEGSTTTPSEPTAPEESTTLSGEISSDMTLTRDKTWILDGLVAIKNGATLTIEAGTTIAGLDGTGDATSYMIIDKGSKIMANGTVDSPIVFTSATVAVNNGAGDVGQWGGLTIIGNACNSQCNPYEVDTGFIAGEGQDADSSGVLRHVKILNSGITMAEDKEINGLSLLGVGNGTVIEDITVDKSDDDGIEIWGGTVNLTNVTITKCTDDHFDIDDGYNGTVKNLVINQTTGNAAIEMSGDTAATFDGFTITQDYSDKEGGIFFKKAGIGGYFLNGTVTDNNMVGELAGAIHSQDIVDTVNMSFTNVTLNGSSTEDRFTGDSAVEIKAVFDAGVDNNAS